MYHISSKMSIEFFYFFPIKNIQIVSKVYCIIGDRTLKLATFRDEPEGL